MPTCYLNFITRFFENLACESVSFNIFFVSENHRDSPDVNL